MLAAHSYKSVSRVDPFRQPATYNPSQIESRSPQNLCVSDFADDSAERPVRACPRRMNRVHIKTYGCQMNERDSEAVAAMLRGRGYRIVAREDECDVMLINTCSVRDA